MLSLNETHSCEATIVDALDPSLPNLLCATRILAMFDEPKRDQERKWAREREKDAKDGGVGRKEHSRVRMEER